MKVYEVSVTAELFFKVKAKNKKEAIAQARQQARGLENGLQLGQPEIMIRNPFSTAVSGKLASRPGLLGSGYCGIVQKIERPEREIKWQAPGFRIGSPNSSRRFAN
jgi:hypothetical protein